jgi:hypothetical protein
VDFVDEEDAGDQLSDSLVDILVDNLYKIRKLRSVVE